MPPRTSPVRPNKPADADSALVLEDGTVFWGVGFGAHGTGEPGELCFSTGMTGYQETLTDPSFARQIITFTFPHIGNVGTNAHDDEADEIAAVGMICKERPTTPSNWRNEQDLPSWLEAHGRTGIWGVDTRAITHLIRERGPQGALIAYPKDGQFDFDALTVKLRAWPGLEGMELGAEAARPARDWSQKLWRQPAHGAKTPEREKAKKDTDPKRRPRIVALDYGAKDNILRHLAEHDVEVRVLPGATPAADIFALDPDGIFLSNGPGDPRETAKYANDTIRRALERKLPLFGICLGHQLLAHALGGKTYKLAQGHRGANQPVKDLRTGKVSITSQNHGFAVDEKSLPPGARASHVSLFDGSNEGIEVADANAFSVQYHPEASPGPHDANHLFKQFIDMIEAHMDGRKGQAQAGADENA